MKIIMKTALALSLSLAFNCFAVAQQQTFAVNPEASKVGFALTGTGHEVHGMFHVTSGSIQFDRTTQKMFGLITVSAASGDSGDKGRDKNMHRQVLEADRYADITFQPQTYTGTIAASGDSTIQVTGIFTLHGTPHDLVVPMQIHIEGQAVTAKGIFVVPYVKWGLKDPSIFVLKVAKQVQLDVTLAGTLTPAS